MTNTNPAVITALLDQDRRLEALEEALGMGAVGLRPNRLVELYHDSFDPVVDSEKESRHWARLVTTLDSSQLLLLARLTGDPFPFRPLLARMDTYYAKDYQVKDAVDHLVSIGQDLLTAQGLGLLRPRDIMGRMPMALRPIRR